MGLGDHDSVDFYMRLSTIRELSLKLDSILIARFLVDFPFRLEKLTMGHMYERNLRSYLDLNVEFQRYLPNDRLIHFLLRQTESLKELAVHNCPRERMLKFIASDLKLTKLELGVAALKPYPDLFAEVKKNSFLKELTLHGKIKEWSTVKQIIEQFPAIESLKLCNSQLKANRYTEMISSLLRIKIIFENAPNEEWNCIQDVDFYIAANNSEEFSVIYHEKAEFNRRMKKLFTAEMKEAIAFKVRTQRIRRYKRNH